MTSTAIRPRPASFSEESWGPGCHSCPFGNAAVRHAYPRCGSSFMMSVPSQERAAAGVAKFPAAGPRVNAGTKASPPTMSATADEEADEQATAKRQVSRDRAEGERREESEPADDEDDADEEADKKAFIARENTRRGRNGHFRRRRRGRKRRTSVNLIDYHEDLDLRRV